MLPTIKILDHAGLTYMKPKTKKKKTLIIEEFCGIALFIVSNIQQLGLYFELQPKATVLTACYIIIVRYLVYSSAKCGLNIWIGVCFSLVGLLFIVHKHGSFSLTFADTLLLCALLRFQYIYLL